MACRSPSPTPSWSSRSSLRRQQQPGAAGAQLGRLVTAAGMPGVVQPPPPPDKLVQMQTVMKRISTTQQQLQMMMEDLKEVARTVSSAATSAPTTPTSAIASFVLPTSAVPSSPHPASPLAPAFPPVYHHHTHHHTHLRERAYHPLRLQSGGSDGGSMYLDPDDASLTGSGGERETDPGVLSFFEDRDDDETLTVVSSGNDAFDTLLPMKHDGPTSPTPRVSASMPRPRLEMKPHPIQTQTREEVEALDDARFSKVSQMLESLILEAKTAVEQPSPTINLSSSEDDVPTYSQLQLAHSRHYHTASPASSFSKSHHFSRHHHHHNATSSSSHRGYDTDEEDDSPPPIRRSLDLLDSSEDDRRPRRRASGRFSNRRTTENADRSSSASSQRRRRRKAQTAQAAPLSRRPSLLAYEDAADGHDARREDVMLALGSPSKGSERDRHAGSGIRTRGGFRPVEPELLIARPASPGIGWRRGVAAETIDTSVGLRERGGLGARRRSALRAGIRPVEELGKASRVGAGAGVAATDVARVRFGVMDDAAPAISPAEGGQWSVPEEGWTGGVVVSPTAVACEGLRVLREPVFLVGDGKSSVAAEAGEDDEEEEEEKWEDARLGATTDVEEERRRGEASAVSDREGDAGRMAEAALRVLRRGEVPSTSTAKLLVNLQVSLLFVVATSAWTIAKSAFGGWGGSSSGASGSSSSKEKGKGRSTGPR